MVVFYRRWYNVTGGGGESQWPRVAEAFPCGDMPSACDRTFIGGREEHLGKGRDRVGGNREGQRERNKRGIERCREREVRGGE